MVAIHSANMLSDCYDFFERCLAFVIRKLCVEETYVLSVFPIHRNGNFFWRRFVIFCKFNERKKLLSQIKFFVSSLHYCEFLNYYHISIIV